MHDTIHFVNPNDIQDKLIAIDRWLFGIEPSIWAQKFIHPWLTEILSFCYMIFFILAPIVAFTLYFQQRINEFRIAMVTVILCYYIGYGQYILFPAVSPNIALKGLYTIQLNGTPIADAGLRMINIIPSTARDAFPSLHTAITLLTLFFAFKFVRWEFWILLPFCVGLILATVYLRHHYVVDSIAGAVLSIIAYFTIPKIDNWWQINMKSYM